MLVLFESPAGFALFKVLKEGKLDEASVGFMLFNINNTNVYM